MNHIDLVNAVIKNEHIDEVPLFDILKTADDQYHNHDAPIMSDAQYDLIRKFASNKYPQNLYLMTVGSKVRGGKVDLPHIMGSLNQIYEGELESWLQQIDDTSVVISDKLDSISGMLIYHRQKNNTEKPGYQTFKFDCAYSRGDGVRGADITRHLSKIDIPETIEVPLSTTYIDHIAIRGEIIVSRKNFPILQKIINARNGSQYKNARNAVAGLINASENPATVYQYIDFVAYELVHPFNACKMARLSYLQDCGFKTVNRVNTDCSVLTEQVIIDHLNDRRYRSDYDIDGMVIEVNDYHIAINMNANASTDSLNPKNAIKYKVLMGSDYVITDVVGVEWTPSKRKYLKPVVLISPVELFGTTVTRASGFNAKFIVDNIIGPGAQVKITKSGMVIPYIMDVITQASFPAMPQTPFKWNETHVDIITQSELHNDDITIYGIVAFFKSIGAEYIGEGNVRTFYAHGLDSIESIICAQRDDLVNILGINGGKIYDSIKAKLTEIPLYKLVGATPFFNGGVGVRKMKKLWDVYGNYILHISHDQIIDVKGFSDILATKIIANLDAVTKFVNVLIDQNVVTIAEFTKVTDNTTLPIAGQTFVFTGFRNKELLNQVENLGGSVKTAVSGKTNYVVTVPGHTGNKITKAHDLGIKIISIEQLQDML